MKLCPPLSRALVNTYRSDIDLFISGETLSSQKGTTQGDPLAMALYAIATVPLIERISNDDVKQSWYTVIYNGATSLGISSSDSTQHSEWQHATVSMV